MPKSPSRFRHWCFTSFQNGVRDPHCSVVFCVGRELAGVTGRAHLQGYVSFEHAKTRSAVAALLGDERVHLEKRRGTEREAVEYCQKVRGSWYYRPKGVPSDINAGIVPRSDVH